MCAMEKINLVPEVSDEQNGRGFDRGINYSQIKKDLLVKLQQDHFYITKDSTKDSTKKELNPSDIWIINRIIKIFIALIQLRNGSRIQEAVHAFYRFYNDPSLKNVRVVLAKSRKNGPLVKTKARHRLMVNPIEWCKNLKPDVFTVMKKLKIADSCIQNKNLKKAVLDYMRKNHKCNTHSLRYAFINHKITDKKTDINVVAKIIGHSNIRYILTYTQQNLADEILQKE